MFKNHFKKLVVIMAAIIVGCAGIHIVQVSAASTMIVGNGKYAIINDTDLSVQYNGPAKKSATSVSIPDTITINDKSYNVIRIADNAFKNNQKIKKLTIGKNVTTIGKNAFYGCKNLKNVDIKTTGLAKNSVGTKAFKGMNAKAVVTVPSEKLVDYKEILRSRGLAGKNQTVKGKKMEEEKTDSVSSNTFNPSEPQVEQEYCNFEIKSEGNQSSGL